MKLPASLVDFTCDVLPKVCLVFFRATPPKALAKVLSVNLLARICHLVLIMKLPASLVDFTCDVLPKVCLVFFRVTPPKALAKVLPDLG
jgi:hypothetical protein